jgi:hypothetical protein
VSTYEVIKVWNGRKKKKYDIHVISVFHHEVAENCTRLGYYGVGSGNFLPTFWTTYQSHPQGSKILILDSGFKILEP